MRTNSRSRGRGLVLGVLALIGSMPELARAQQAGLFPNAPIRRQRVPCDQEDSVYKIYKQKYFGYHPTCWQPFPSGWGCPSPEKPDVNKSFRERKLGADAYTPPGGTEEGAEGTPAPAGLRPPVPTLPGGRSPFDTPTNGEGGANPANPAGAPREREKAVSPFDIEKPPAAAPDAPRANRTRPSNQPTGEGGPELSAPDQPVRSGGARTSRYSPEEETNAREDDGPLLALPNVTLPPVSVPDTPFGTEPAQASTTTTTTDATPTSTTPAASAPRRGFLSGLFNNLGWNWTRR